jgi:hypothetical protein
MESSVYVLLACIVGVGLAHTLTGYYREKAHQRHRREAMRRLGYRSWTEQD